MSQAREIWDFLVLSRDTFEWCEGAMVLMTFRWYEGAMVFCVSIFSFCKETTVIERKQWDGNDFCRCYRCYGNIFSKVSFRKYLVTAMFKVLSQQLRGTLTTTFEKHFTIEDFKDVDQHRCQVCNKKFDL